MEMHQVRYFLAVAEELNFTRAAEKCNVAQPSLTRAIKLLEDELGGPLFHRERAKTHLSELGRMVRAHLQQIYDESLAAKRLAQDFTKLKKVTLKLGVMCTIAPTQLTELISSIQTRYPTVELDLTVSGAQELHRNLMDGEIEVAIYAWPSDDTEERLHLLPLFREQMMIALSPKHHLTAKNAITPKDLQNERYVNRINCEFNGVSLPQLDDIEFKTVFSSERDDWVMAMIASGTGFGFLPEYSVSHSGIVMRPLIEPELWREVNLVTVRGRPHSPAVGALVREAMQFKWRGQPSAAVNKAVAQSRAKTPQNVPALN
jgi:LysR family transcriptional regulator, hydrogen peroxide-inducible genes activator